MSQIRQLVIQLTQNLCTAISFAEVRRALIVKQRQLHSLRMLTALARIALLALCHVRYLSVRAILQSPTTVRPLRTPLAAGTAALFRPQRCGPARNHQRRPVALVRLVHQHGAPEHLLQGGADHMEIGRRLPARFHLTAARHAVAFAADLHVPGEHQPAGMVVVQIDLRLDVAGLFARVEEHLGEGDAVVHVVRAAAPFPAGRVASAVRGKRIDCITFLKFC